MPFFQTRTYLLEPLPHTPSVVSITCWLIMILKFLFIPFSLSSAIHTQAHVQKSASVTASNIRNLYKGKGKMGREEEG